MSDQRTVCFIDVVVVNDVAVRMSSTNPDPVARQPFFLPGIHLSSLLVSTGLQSSGVDVQSGDSEDSGDRITIVSGSIMEVFIHVAAADDKYDQGESG